MRVGGRRILASARITPALTSDAALSALSRFASNGRPTIAIGASVSSKFTSGAPLRAASTLAATVDGGEHGQGSHRPWSGGLAAGMLAAAALAATAQNAAGDRAECCGIAGVVGGENIDAR